MSWQLQEHAAFERPWVALCLLRPGRLGCILCLGGVTQGCAATPMAPFAGPNPSDASARIPAVSYRSTIGFFATWLPVEAAAWKKEDEPVSPAPNRAPRSKS
jgi:hypothetical protein